MNNNSSIFHRTILVNIFYIRHGYSCSNIMKHRNRDESFQVPDPLLTNTGVTNSKSSSKMVTNHIKGIDMVISSTLMRAMETAYFMFPYVNKIHIYPFISEIGSSPSNTPLDEQNKYLDPNLVKKLNRNEVPDHSHISKLDKTTEPNTKDFLNILGKSIHKYIDINKKKINIVVVTHSGFIRNNIKSGSVNEEIEKVRNNSVYLQKYEFNFTNRTLSLLPCYESREKCNQQSLVMEGKKSDDSNYCQAVGRCKSSIPKKPCNYGSLKEESTASNWKLDSSSGGSFFDSTTSSLDSLSLSTE